MFGSNFGFMQDMYGKSGALVIRELWHRKSNVENVVFSLFERILNEHLAKWGVPIDLTNPEKTKIENWKDLNAIFVQQLLELPDSLTLKEWQKHFGKHVFPITVLNARKNAEADSFYGSIYIIGEDEEGEGESLNSVIIVKGEDAVRAAKSIFDQGNPQLELRGGGIFLSLNDPGFTLSKIDYERCFCIFGAPKKNLTKGLLQPIPSDYARDIQIYGGIKLNCFGEDGSITHPGTLYPKIDRPLAQRIRALPPTSEQAELAALLGFYHTLTSVNFNNEQLIDAKNRLSVYLRSVEKKRKNREAKLYLQIIKFLEGVPTSEITIIDESGENENKNINIKPTNDFYFPSSLFSKQNLSQDDSENLSLITPLGDTYRRFFLFNSESFEEMIRIFCKISPEISLEEGIFDWSQKDILQQELETRPDLKNRLKLFANFVFDHKN